MQDRHWSVARGGIEVLTFATEGLFRLCYVVQATSWEMLEDCLHTKEDHILKVSLVSHDIWDPESMPGRRADYSLMLISAQSDSSRLFISSFSCDQHRSFPPHRVGPTSVHCV